jgi:hypothetical protein
VGVLAGACSSADGRSFRSTIPGVLGLLSCSPAQVSYALRLAAQLFSFEEGYLLRSRFGCEDVLVGGVVDGQLRGRSRRFRAVALDLSA